MTKLNILHLTTYLQGGAGKVVVDLAKASKLKGNNVTVACTKKAVGDYHNYPEHLDEIKKLGIRLNFPGSFFSREKNSILKTAINLKENLGGKIPDVIHTHAATPSRIAMQLSSLTERNIPIIQTMHGWGIYKSINQQKEDIDTLNKVDHIVCVSNSSLKLLQRKQLLNKHTSVIYNGIDESSNKKKFNDIRIFNEISRLKKNGAFICGVIGTVDERKNQRLVIEAFKYLSSKVDIHCYIFGEGNLIDSLTKLCIDYELSERIKFIGYKKYAREFISSLDLLVCPSRSEGIPVTVIEAFAEKTLVLASDIQEHKEIITNKENGFLFIDNSVIDLVDKIKDILISKQTHECINNARSYFENNFQFASTIDKYNSLYKKYSSFNYQKN